ncbi:hypothetical protein MF406_17765 [Georgenia sp. TF02-10]|uniref:hypothetical protein n=1 Tax=Georgenia sp. TF02-10 TaxID=2917725 RepID=UPI001FA6B347|nr:hypothetical protein [Georgenia sp. TF02-10]UNX54696.1 hypothetical protein MF406_17765 [Georgenia sp. TF02-10]
MAAAAGLLLHRPEPVPAEDQGDITGVSYVVLPHADDEAQVWSLLEHTPQRYKVFILATRSEQSGYCEPATYTGSGWQPDLEPAATPAPQGRWSSECEQARLASFVGFLTQMSRSDPSIPGRFEAPRTVGPFPAEGTDLCRRDTLEDAGSAACTPQDLRDAGARVLLDTEGRGAVVQFNLGDGDLTAEEVAWAVRTVQGHRAELGLNTTAVDHDVLAIFWNEGLPDCKSYPHPDHRAVHEAVLHVDFGARYQAGATCASDPRARWSRTLSPASVHAAWQLGPDQERLGAHVRNYGWLYNPYYLLDEEGQAELFHSHQSFWLSHQH